MFIEYIFQLFQMLQAWAPKSSEKTLILKNCIRIFWDLLHTMSENDHRLWIILYKNKFNSTCLLIY